MKFYQQKVFQQIGIVLETADEAHALWDIVRFVTNPSELSVDAQALATKISDILSNQAQLGGD